MNAQRILIVGAGAIGCTLAWHLSATSAEVALVARGASLEAIAKNGITLYKEGQLLGQRRLRVQADYPVAERWDAVLLCVKQYDLAATLRALQPLLAPSTALIPVVNGIPWWLLRSHAQLKSQANATWGDAYAQFPEIALQQVIGAVIHIPAQMRAACTVEQGARNTLALGEIDGALSARLLQIAATINESALQCTASPEIQSVLWNKLLGNAVFNPVSALAHASMGEILHDPGLRALCALLIEEVLAVGNALGYPQAISAEQRLQQAASAGHARTSMLQDVLAGKPIEGETLVGIVTQIARCLRIETPALNGVWALLKSRYMRAD